MKISTPLRDRIPWDRVNWKTSVFLAVINITAVTVVPVYLWKNGIDLFQISLFLFYYVATGMSITLGYHRLFSHLSFKARAPVKLFTLIFGACAFENSALDWASDHRKHHKHVDHDDDPYDISKGFFWAHIGWLLFKLGPEKPMDNVNDLKRDPLVMWQHRWCFVLAFTVGFALPVILGYLRGGTSAALGAFLIAGILRVFAVQHSTFFINSMCHTFGHQPYSNKCSARDSLLMALFTFGEGYHNYHHEFQHDYRNGVKPTNFDPTKWTIWLLEKIGLVSDLRRVKESKILLAEMAEVSRRAQLLLESKQLTGAPILEEPPHSTWHILVSLWQDRIKTNLENLQTSIAAGSEVSKEHLGNWRRETRIFLSQISKLKSLPAPRTA